MHLRSPSDPGPAWPSPGRNPPSSAWPVCAHASGYSWPACCWSHGTGARRPRKTTRRGSRNGPTRAPWAAVGNAVVLYRFNATASVPRWAWLGLGRRRRRRQRLRLGAELATVVDIVSWEGGARLWWAWVHVIDRPLAASFQQQARETNDTASQQQMARQKRRSENGAEQDKANGIAVYAI